MVYLSSPPVRDTSKGRASKAEVSRTVPLPPFASLGDRWRKKRRDKDGWPKTHQGLYDTAGSEVENMVYFLNLCQEHMSVYWRYTQVDDTFKADSPAIVRIVDIEPGKEHEVKSYNYHQFMMAPAEGNTRLRVFTIQPGVNRYVLANEACD